MVFVVLTDEWGRTGRGVAGSGSAPKKPGEGERDRHRVPSAMPGSAEKAHQMAGCLKLGMGRRS